MYIEILVKYVHFVSVFIIVSAVVVEHLLLKPTLTRKEISRLSKVDMIYGIASITLLMAGMTLWFVIGKPAVFYSQNWIFLSKIGLFTLVGLLSLYPTIFFFRNKKGNEGEVVVLPKSIKTIVRIELLILFTIPLLASFMAKGVGYFD